jgi:hypothetical protein
MKKIKSDEQLSVIMYFDETLYLHKLDLWAVQFQLLQYNSMIIRIIPRIMYVG